MKPCLRLSAPLALLAILAPAVFAATPPAAGATAGRPNVVLIVADDLGFADLGAQGSADMKTPHLDTLARGSAVFTQAYVTAPVCMPSRMGLLTGRYQQRFGMQTLGNDRIGIPASETNLGQMLHAAGYATGIVGKWHVGTNPEFRPNVRGFDEFYGFLNGNTPYYPGTGTFWRNDQVIEKPAYLTDGFGDEAVSFINRHAEKPFFLYLSFNAPHAPMQAPERYLARFAHIPDEGRRIYAAMTAAMDDAIGRVLETLRVRGLEENTVVMFLSDNGGAPQNYSDNRPLRSGKYEVFEGGNRTPLFIRWPAGGVRAGAHGDIVVSALDLVPTILAATRADYTPKLPLDGENLLPLLRGQPHQIKADRRLYWRYGPYQAALRAGDWKIVQFGVGENKHPAWELYNLARDPGETRDLAAAEPARLRALVAEFEAWDRSLPPATIIDKRLLDGVIWWRKKAALDGSAD
jgi:arylsulfatase A-like enzyme